MSYSTTRYGRQSVSNDESLVSYVQNLRFDVSDSDGESYLDPDEETDSSDGGQDDPRSYGICPGEFAPDPISNDDYRCGNVNFDYIKAWWPETIPRHYTWDGKYPADERDALVDVEAKIGITLRDMPGYGQWVHYTLIYRQLIMPYIATITYSDSNAPVTLSYALLREPGGEVNVVGVELDRASPHKITVVSRWHVVGAGKRDASDTNTEDILGFKMPPTPRRDEWEWSAPQCQWWVPRSRVPGSNELRATLHFPRDEVVKRSGQTTRSSRGTGHRHRVRR